MINIVIADDHKIVLEGLSSLIALNNDMSVVGEAINGKEVLTILKAIKVDIVVLDIEMPEMNGVEAAKIIRKDYPEVKVLILTMYNEIGFIRKIAETGAHGYILKNRGKEELIEAILTVFEGGQYFGKEVTKTMFSGMKKEGMAGEIHLTKREKEILKLIADGYTTPKISQQLSIAPTTVETHRRNLIEKTGVPNTKGLVRFAIENGYTS
ncbi:response regulator [Psychroserpens sp.]